MMIPLVFHFLFVLVKMIALVGRKWAYCTNPRSYRAKWNIGMVIDGGRRKYSEKNLPQCHMGYRGD
jgi:hypothetical protein